MDTIKFCVQDFYCDTYCSSDDPASTNQEIPTGHTNLLSSYHEISEYRLPHLLSKSQTFGHIPLIPYWHSLATDHDQDIYSAEHSNR